MRNLGAIVVVGWLAMGCGGGIIPARPTQTVRVVGPTSDALGRTIESDARGFVRVELHEGPMIWVEPDRVAPAALAPWTDIVVADATGALSAAVVIEDLDHVIAVLDGSGQRVLVPLERVVAAMHTQHAHEVVVAPPAPPVVVTPPAPPPPDPRRFATLATGTELLERVHVVSCSGAMARVLGDDGGVVSVAVRDLRPIRVQVGDRVGALWQNGDTTYAGVVTALEGRLANIRYDDGSEEWVQPTQIVRREGSPGGGGGACPRGGEGFAMVRRGAMRRVVEVVSCAGDRVMVHAPGDGPTETAALSDLRALAVSSGSRIEVMWHQSSPYAGWAGTTHDGGVDVRYDDGSNEPAPLTDLRWIASDWEGEPFLCPGVAS